APASVGAYPFEDLSLEDVERMHIERILARCGGQKARAATILGINRTTLWKKLRQYGVEGADPPRGGVHRVRRRRAGAADDRRHVAGELPRRRRRGAGRHAR